LNWRKSWAHDNIYGKENNGYCTNRSLLPDERSVWDDYLDLATLNIIPGQISISPSCGYSPEQLGDLLKTSVDIIRRANTKLQDMNSILIENNGVIIILNWKNYQTDWERVKGYTNNPTTEPTKKHTEQTRVDIDKRYIRKEYKSMYPSILSIWNSKKIIIHKYMNTYIYGRINGKLDHGFTLEDIKTAIDNYDHILKGKQYFCTKEWGLGEFLQRGFDKFLDLEGAKRRYADKYRDKDLFNKEVNETRKEMRDE